MPDKPKEAQVTSGSYALKSGRGISFSFEPAPATPGDSGQPAGKISYDAIPVVQWAIAPKVAKFNINQSLKGDKVTWSLR